MSEVIVKDQLIQIVTKIERLEKEKKDIQDTIKDVFKEAEGYGFDVKIIKQVLKLRKKDKSELEEEEELLAIYRDALGI